MVTAVVVVGLANVRITTMENTVRQRLYRVRMVAAGTAVNINVIVPLIGEEMKRVELVQIVPVIRPLVLEHTIKRVKHRYVQVGQRHIMNVKKMSVKVLTHQKKDVLIGRNVLQHLERFILVQHVTQNMTYQMVHVFQIHVME